MATRVVWIALSLTFLACSSASPPPIPLTDVDPVVSEFHEAENAHREDVGCAPLEWDDAVAAVAQAHTEDMADRGFFSHDNPDGQSPFDRLQDAGISWSGQAGENIAMLGGDGTDVLELWLSSSGHRANIEDCAYTHHGVGYFESLWTDIFLFNVKGVSP